MVKVKSKAESDREAQNALFEMKRKMGTWQGVQDELKISKGYLNRVARGQRTASNRLRTSHRTGSQG